MLCSYILFDIASKFYSSKICSEYDEIKSNKKFKFNLILGFQNLALYIILYIALTNTFLNMNLKT